MNNERLYGSMDKALDLMRQVQEELNTDADFTPDKDMKRLFENYGRLLRVTQKQSKILNEWVKFVSASSTEEETTMQEIQITTAPDSGPRHKNNLHQAVFDLVAAVIIFEVVRRWWSAKSSDTG